MIEPKDEVSVQKISVKDNEIVRNEVTGSNETVAERRIMKIRYACAMEHQNKFVGFARSDLYTVEASGKDSNDNWVYDNDKIMKNKTLAMDNLAKKIEKYKKEDNYKPYGDVI